MAANAAERWAEAEQLFDELTREYPRDPLTWALLGRARLRQGKGHEAAAAYLRAGPLIGWDLQHGNGYRAAAAYARAGDEGCEVEAAADDVGRRCAIAPDLRPRRPRRTRPVD